MQVLTGLFAQKYFYLPTEFLHEKSVFEFCCRHRFYTETTPNLTALTFEIKFEVFQLTNPTVLVTFVQKQNDAYFSCLKP